MDSALGGIDRETEYDEPSLVFLDDGEETDDNRGLKTALIIMSVFALICVLVMVISLILPSQLWR